MKTKLPVGWEDREKYNMQVQVLVLVWRVKQVASKWYEGFTEGKKGENHVMLWKLLYTNLIT